MLTLRTNGSGPTNIVTSTWWNDYYNLLTGVMQDQPMTFLPNLTMKGVVTTASTAATNATVSAGGSCSVGTYALSLTYVMADGGETLPGTTGTVTTTSTNKTINWTGITIGPTGTTARKLYRSKVGTTSPLYLVTTINNNTATTFTDSVADTSLTVQAPSHSTFGGSLIFKDASGTVNLTIAPDGSFTGAGGSTTLGSTTITGTLTISGDLDTDGKIGVTASADIIDASGNDTYLKSRSTGTIRFQVPNGTTVGTLSASSLALGTLGLTCGNITSTGNIQSNGVGIGFGGTINIASGGTISASNLTISGNNFTVNGTGAIFGNGVQTNGVLLLQPGNTATPSAIQVGTAGFGVKNNSGTRLFEVQNNGNIVVSGVTIKTTNTSAQYTTGGTFDSFDLAESYIVDEVYPNGTVVCPQDITTVLPAQTTSQPYGGSTVTQCTHDMCNNAVIITTVPAVSVGWINYPNSPQGYDDTVPLMQGTVLSGRVFARTTQSIAGKKYVCSDGAGGVREMVSGDSGMALGVTFCPTDTDSGTIATMFRPTFVTIP